MFHISPIHWIGKILYTRCLMLATNQADPSCFYFRMNIDGTTLILFTLSPPFNARPQKPQALTASKIKYENFCSKI